MFPNSQTGHDPIDIVDAVPLYRWLRDDGIPREALLVLHQAGAHDATAILDVLDNFPSLAEAGLLNAADISSALYASGDPAVERYAEYAKAFHAQAPHVFGASAPPDAYWQDGDEVPLELDGKIAARERLDGEVDVGIDRCGDWLIRSQGQRGTCVAHAVVAMFEHARCTADRDATDLSEQFLQWAIKTSGDRWPTQEGTTCADALAALANHGVCAESEWPYDPVPVAGNPAQGDANNPSLTARFDARMRRVRGYRHFPATRRGNAAPILALLRAGSPVAVSVPVFRDRLIGYDNWNTPGGQQFGAVTNPLPTSIVDGGHAVLLVGYVPDALDPLGGRFVFRNSWSPQWGHALPAPGRAAPRPGYGEISASYIDQHLWEYATL
jgi:hypothetical protein